MLRRDYVEKTTHKLASLDDIKQRDAPSQQRWTLLSIDLEYNIGDEEYAPAVLLERNTISPSCNRKQKVLCKEVHPRCCSSAGAEAIQPRCRFASTWASLHFLPRSLCVQYSVKDVVRLIARMVWHTKVRAAYSIPVVGSHSSDRRTLHGIRHASNAADE
jgi:hypothetical protein